MFKRKKKFSLFKKKSQRITTKRKFFSFKRKKQTSGNKSFVFGGRVNFWRRLFIKLGYFALFSSFLGLIFVFFFTSFFVIENINLERENFRVDTGEVIDSLKEYRYRNILLISTSQIEKQIKEDFPEYKTAIVKRVFPNSLMIQVKNFDIIAQAKVYIEPQSKVGEFDIETIELKPYEQVLALNSEGIIEPNNEAYESLPVLELFGIQKTPLVQGDHLVLKKYLDLIWKSKERLQESLTINVTHMIFFPDAKEVHLKTEQGYEIWVDFMTPVEEQIDKLKKISNHVDWNENPPTEHIDLRIKNRIIYK